MKMESKCESLPMEWITQHELKLANTFCKARLLEAKRSTIAEVEDHCLHCCTNYVGNKKHCGQKLQCSEPHRSLASDDLCKVTAEERRWAI